jgi:nucleoside-diphosphate-sugar epimerase
LVGCSYQSKLWEAIMSKETSAARNAASTAVVTGATGITGRYCIKSILKCCPEWSIVTLSRRSLDLELPQASTAGKQPHMAQAKADLTDMNAIRDALGSGDAAAALGDKGTRKIFVYHCAYVDCQDPFKDCQFNLAMLKNTVEALGEA